MRQVEGREKVKVHISKCTSALVIAFLFAVSQRVRWREYLLPGIYMYSVVVVEDLKYI